MNKSFVSSPICALTCFDDALTETEKKKTKKKEKKEKEKERGRKIVQSLSDQCRFRRPTYAWT